MRRWLVSLAVVVMALGIDVGVSPAATGPALPSVDPFYTYGGSLTNVAPGTVLKTRQIEVSVSGESAPYAATQVLYRTDSQLGAPVATVATIIRPPGASALPAKLLSYQIAYDCDTGFGRPSYQLEGGQPASDYVTLEVGPMLSYLSQGYTVVTSDYEGPDDEWGAGQEAGYETLDGIRAAEHELDVSTSTPSAIVGYSGGSIATMWAYQEQPTYAPKLNIFAAAAGGIPVDYYHTINYIDGTSSAGVLPSILLGLFRAYHLDENTYLSASGLKDFATASTECLSGNFINNTAKGLLKPQYQDYTHVPALVHVLNDSIMGLGAAPKEPLLLGAANNDGTGDGLMITGDMEGLAQSYCRRGVSVQFQIYKGLTHVEGDEVFNTQAPTFLESVAAGAASNGCSSIAAGNPLTPMPIPASQSPTLAVAWPTVGISRPSHGLVVHLRSHNGTLGRVTVKLERGTQVRGKATVTDLTVKTRRIVLRIGGHIPSAGRYTLVLFVNGHDVAHRGYIVR